MCCCESQHTDRRRHWALIPAWSAWSRQQSGAHAPVPVVWACPHGWPIRIGTVRWWNRAACVWCVPATPSESKQTLRYKISRWVRGRMSFLHVQILHSMKLQKNNNKKVKPFWMVEGEHYLVSWGFSYERVASSKSDFIVSFAVWKLGGENAFPSNELFYVYLIRMLALSASFQIHMKLLSFFVPLFFNTCWCIMKIYMILNVMCRWSYQEVCFTFLFPHRKSGRVSGQRSAPNLSTSPSGTARACRHFVLVSVVGVQTLAAVRRTPPRRHPWGSAARTEPPSRDLSCSSVRVCATITAQWRTGYPNTDARPVTPPSSLAELVWRANTYKRHFYSFEWESVWQEWGLIQKSQWKK